MLYSQQRFSGSSTYQGYTRCTISSFLGQYRQQNCMSVLCFARRAAGAAGYATAVLMPTTATIKCSRLWPIKPINCRHLVTTAPHSFGTAGMQANTPTRADAAIALDVEYVHMKLPGGIEQSAPAWVALVDDQCNVLLNIYANPQVPDGARCFGGVPPTAWAAAPPLTAVVEQLRALTAGKLLVGHGLAKDLAALGMQHPDALMFDTMTHPAFCNKAGSARSLRQLAKVFLNINIQQQPRVQQHGGASKQQQGSSAGRQQQRGQHDPEEDATAVMQLYQKVVVPSTYEGQVAAATQQVLMEAQQRQQQLQEQEQEEGLSC